MSVALLYGFSPFIDIIVVQTDDVVASIRRRINEQIKEPDASRKRALPLDS